MERAKEMSERKSSYGMGENHIHQQQIKNLDLVIYTSHPNQMKKFITSN